MSIAVLTESAIEMLLNVIAPNYSAYIPFYPHFQNFA